MTWLFFALSWLRKGFAALLGVITKHPWQAACVALLCLSLWSYRGWTKEANAYTAFRADLVRAQAESIAKQKAADRDNVIVQTARNRKVSDDIASAEISRRSDLARYVAANRVRPQACRSASETPPLGLPVDPGSAVGAGEAAALVSVSEPDLELLSAASLRGSICTGFLNGLVQEGLAVKVE